MVDIAYQRRMASQLLKCGTARVWIDPKQIDEVSEAVTKKDIRRLISYRVIQVHPKSGVSRGRARARTVKKLKGRRRGPGSRKGAKYARTPRKRGWILKIRPIREELRRLREEGKLDQTTYRAYYKKARGGMFHSRNHLLSQLQAAGIIKEGPVKREHARVKKLRDEGTFRRKKAAKARELVKRKAEETKKAKDEEASAKETAAKEKVVEKADKAEAAKKVDAAKKAETTEKADKAEAAKKVEAAKKAETTEKADKAEAAKKADKATKPPKEE